MAEELEIKLTLAEADLPRVVDWVSARADARAGAAQDLFNRYYDTEDAALNRQQAALRVRRSGAGYVQTLKTRGEFVAGAHCRQEWEWPLSEPELDLSLLAQTPVADTLNPESLAPVFETNFRRQIWLFSEAGAEVEMALDQGMIISGVAQHPLCEVEFERKSGASRLLLDLARELADQVPVFLNLVSKAEQGYFLAGIYRPQLVPAPEPLSVTGFLHLLSVAWLLDKPVAVAALSLDPVREAAARAGEAAALQALLDALAAGRSVRSLAAERRLGQLQLALAAA